MSAAEVLGEKLEAIIQKRIAGDRLELPSMPEAATRALAVVREPDFSMRNLIEALERDPVLCVQVMKTATSAAFGGSDAPTLEQACSRLGTQKLKTLLTQVCASKVFESRDRRIRRANQELWAHSLAVAILGRDLLALSGSMHGDAAYLAGLLHDIGKPVVAAFLLDAEKQIKELRNSAWIDSDTWIEVVENTHRDVAVALAQKWDLPEAVVAGIRDCSDYDMGDREAIGNYVRFANAVAKIHGIYVGDPDIDDANAMIMLGRTLLSLDDDILDRLTADLENRVKAGM